MSALRGEGRGRPRRGGGRRVFASLLVSGLAACGAAGATEPSHLSAAELLGGRGASVVGNGAFTPPADARPAHQPFSGALRLGPAPMRTAPAPLSPARVLGKDPALFPAVELAFFTVGEDLVPATQEVIRSGSAGHGASYWDFIVQPGRVWSEPGDGLWSRAAFPFALVHSLEGETHNGLATFLYRDRRVSGLRFQIVQQTAPFYIATPFTAAGVAPALYRAIAIRQRPALEREYRSALADAVPIGTWEALGDAVGRERLEGFDATLPAGEGVAAGLDYRGTFYLKYCTSAGGPLPWCDRARFGVWSATKALANETALLRLAQKYGPAVFDLRISDYVPAAAGRGGWDAVRFHDAIDMATGLGNGSTVAQPNHAEDGYLEGDYSDWYEARTRAAKVRALLRTAGVYPWGPGAVTRYRDQDMFILGVAMDAFLKSKEGRTASIWSMLEREVYRPIGIHYAPTNRTLEAGDGPGHPLMAFGYYPTLGDMVKIARLYENDGRAGGEQILYAPGVRALAAGPAPRGLPTGQMTPGGETTYAGAFWHVRVATAQGCQLYVPVMEGWGGNLVALLPAGLVALRVAKARGDAGGRASDPTSMITVASRLASVCP